MALTGNGPRASYLGDTTNRINYVGTLRPARYQIISSNFFRKFDFKLEFIRRFQFYIEIFFSLQLNFYS